MGGSDYGFLVSCLFSLSDLGVLSFSLSLPHRIVFTKQNQMKSSWNFSNAQAY